MDSLGSQTPSMSTPQVKFENSPAESFISTPGGDMYPPLFGTSSTSASNQADSVMTPSSCADDLADADPSSVQGTPSPSGDADKKTTKKRKSWGQVLPEPKTNLPPRKRAKTEDEKEQRRVERVLRNRRAAQSSRERKRQEVEALEIRNQELEGMLRQQQKQNLMLMEELTKFRRSSGVVTRGSSPLDSLQPSPLTLSQPLFGLENAASKSGMMNDFILMPEDEATADPASLSPELAPVPDSAVATAPAVALAKPATSTTTTTDVTQHPAAVLCDQQCPSVEVPQLWTASPPQQTAPALFLQFQLLWTLSSMMLSACQRPLTLIAGALKHNLVLQATPSILSTIIWMVTLPANSPISTSTSSSATTSAAPLLAQPRETSPSPMSPNLSSASSTLRIKSLQKILTCSPRLARPLVDATLELLRLVSEGSDDRVERLADGSPGIKGDRSRGPHMLWPDGASLPSRETLFALLWAIKVEERKLKATGATIAPQPASTSRPGSSVLQDKKTNQTNVLSKSAGSKRKTEPDVNGSERLRLGY